MNSYKVLNNQVYSSGEYKLVPIRYEDRINIMKWRNEQLYHLRQQKPLTVEDQDYYFNHIISNLFDQEKPNQILFSLLENDICIGYGGLVHINWIDKNAEVSFIMNTELEAENFNEIWKAYLFMLDEVAFQQLRFHKIYTYAFDLRPQLYNTLENAGYYKEAVLKEHCFFEDKFIDVIIHSKSNHYLELRNANHENVEIAFEWANNSIIRKYSIDKNPISWEQHKFWFEHKIDSDSCVYYFLFMNNFAVGSIRFDIENSKAAKISYLIDSKYHGKNLGKYILKNGIEKVLTERKEICCVYGHVMKENIASIKLFQQLNFTIEKSENNLLTFTKKCQDENC